MMVYRMFGIHTATIGGVFPFTAKVDDTVWKRMYEKLKPRPTPKLRPMPPLVFLQERVSPMVVRMKAAKAMAMTAIDLLANGAEKALEIKKNFKPLLTKEEYIEC